MPDDDKIDFSMFLNDYLNDAREAFQEINTALIAFEKAPKNVEQLDIIFRGVHTLKSSSRMLEFTEIAEFAHTTEDLIDRMRKKEIQANQENIDLLFEAIDLLENMVKQRGEGKGANTEYHVVASKIHNITGGKNEALRANRVKTQMTVIEKIDTVRVRMELLDSMFDLTGELMIIKNRIDNLVSSISNKELSNALNSMDHLIGGLHENVSAARLVPVDETFQKFPRMVRDLAKERGKEIEFIMEGRDIELDKSMLDSLGEPLMHLLRNAIDHGIEPPDEREKNNKLRAGTIRLSARRTENNIEIYVEDDGAGIDAARMKEAFVRKGLIDPEEARTITDDELLDHLYRPGFTTTEKVSGVSGRGMGLYIVKTAAEKMGGTVELSTHKGKGSRFGLKLPLSTAILQTMMVAVNDKMFALPSDIVLETMEVKPQDIRKIGKDTALVLRKEIIPYTHLAQLLNMPHAEGANEYALIIYRGNSFHALGVDAVLDQMENIIKPFDPIAQQFRGFSGGTILGDGRVVLLLDIPGMLGLKTVKERS